MHGARPTHLEGDAHGNRVPRRLHPVVCLGRLLAYRAARVVSGELAEAVPVYGVAARELVARVAGREEVLLAHGAAAILAGRG